MAFSWQHQNAIDAINIKIVGIDGPVTLCYPPGCHGSPERNPLGDRPAEKSLGAMACWAGPGRGPGPDAFQGNREYHGYLGC
jgi:hypothetical protein